MCSLQNSRPLHYRLSPIPDHSALMDAVVTEETAANVVVSEVASTLVIDLHTHLLPPSHGALCLWGIDELLSYVGTNYRFSLRRETFPKLKFDAFIVPSVTHSIILWQSTL